MAKATDSRRRTKAPQYDEVVHTRVTTKVKRLVEDKAREAGYSPSTWVRVVILRALGLAKD